MKVLRLSNSIQPLKGEMEVTQLPRGSFPWPSTTMAEACRGRCSEKPWEHEQISSLEHTVKSPHRPRSVWQPALRSMIPCGWRNLAHRETSKKWERLPEAQPFRSPPGSAWFYVRVSEYFAEGGCAFVQPDLGSCGGITACKKIAHSLKPTTCSWLPMSGWPDHHSSALQISPTFPMFSSRRVSINQAAFSTRSWPTHLSGTR